VVAGEFSTAVGPSRNEFLYAASINDLATVKQMIAGGADVNQSGEFDYTALHMAARNGHIEMAQLLIENGAIVDARNRSKMTPFHWAARVGNLPMLEFLLSKGADINALGESRDPTDTSQVSHSTPIDLAAANNHFEIVDWLKANGAN
jgi:ankyrin repeat protein